MSARDRRYTLMDVRLGWTFATGGLSSLMTVRPFIWLPSFARRVLL
jgi:hypothetical protein